MSVITNYRSITHPSSFSGLNIVKRYNPDVSVQRIENLLASQTAYSKYKQSKRPRKYNKYFIYSRRSSFQMDLLSLPELSKHNFGIKYILCVVSSFSRKLWTVPMITKTAEESKNAIESVMNHLETLPKQIVCDR